MRKFSRQEIWQHNSFLGHVAMAKGNLNSIMRSETATSAAKQKAAEIWAQLDTLGELLKTRTDQENKDASAPNQ